MKHFIDLLKSYTKETEIVDKFRELVKAGDKNFLENCVFGEQRSLSKANLTDREIQIVLSTINWAGQNQDFFLPTTSKSVVDAESASMEDDE
jgi:hypothetical protein